MRLPPPNAPPQSSPSFGPGNPSLPGSTSSFDGGDQGLVAIGTRTIHSRRGSDYRLRGVDLGSEETPAPLAKKYRPNRRRRRRLALKWVAGLAVAALAAVLLRVDVVQPFSVPSAAMAPTLQAGDRILVVKSRPLAGPFRSGDIVVFQRPKFFPCSVSQKQTRDLVQRVIAVPGDTIWSMGNKIYLNGKRLEEKGWYDPLYGQVGSRSIVRTKVAAGEYFVLSDNRSDSCDSRAFGTISRSSILGKVFAVVGRNGHPYIHFF